MSENELTSDARIVALVRDLMFASRVRGVAPEATVARSREGLLEAVGPGTRLVIVELEASGALEAVREARSLCPDARLVAFAPHVMEEKLAAAREAGADALPRGAFVKGLAGLVAEARQ